MRSGFSMVMGVACGALGLCACARSTPAWSAPPTNDDMIAKRGEAWRWNFDEPSTAPFAGTLPFESPRRMFHSVLGDWRAIGEDDAPSAPNVYRQAAAMKGDDAPRVFVGSLVFADFVARVACNPVSGNHAQGCGLIVRAQDADDYDLARWDAVQGRLELVRVVDGREDVMASANAPKAYGGWHTLVVSAHLRVVSATLDDVTIDTRDTTFSEGKIGLWTRADAVTDFDDLEIAAE
jgi:hypothetical protein